jgi:UDP-N-acetylglucosamine--N-acetylmuramyl-(pentapeptide) pyrophosphoryl-undecaprenol N-acetylglucosamine transferase
VAANVQLIWQTGKHYYEDINRLLAIDHDPSVHYMAFLNRMDLAYAAADLIISRAGAGTIAELCIVGKPVILVPSPNVAEDHQTKNAQNLVQDNACEYVADRKAGRKLVDAVLTLLNDDKRRKVLSDNISKLALPDADEVIAKQVFEIAK